MSWISIHTQIHYEKINFSFYNENQKILFFIKNQFLEKNESDCSLLRKCSPWNFLDIMEEK
jgi:hypothetical protein